MRQTGLLVSLEQFINRCGEATIDFHAVSSYLFKVS